jgi:nucleoid DNA-binding protein
MNKHDLVKFVAARDDVPHATAADHVDNAIHQILRQLRKGASVSLPGVGTLKPNSSSRIELSPPRNRSGKKRW